MPNPGERNYHGELPFQNPRAPIRETDAREQHDAVQQGGMLIPGTDTPVVPMPPTPGGPDDDATGWP